MQLYLIEIFAAYILSLSTLSHREQRGPSMKDRVLTVARPSVSRKYSALILTGKWLEEVFEPGQKVRVIARDGILVVIPQNSHVNK